MTEINLLVWLVLGHVVCDFYFQPDSWVKEKNTKHYKSLALFYHAVIHSVVSIVVLLIARNMEYEFSVFWGGLIVFITHYLIDLAKSYASPKLSYFLIDQVAHLIVLLVLWILMTGQISQLATFLVSTKISYKMVVYIVAYVMVFKPASIFISMLLRPWTDNVKPRSPANNAGDSLQDAGRQIGYLERFLILTFILLNQYSVIGFLLAAKSVFRFGDLKDGHDKKLTEYVMLGTLASVTVTISIGLIVVFLVGNVTLG